MVTNLPFVVVPEEIFSITCLLWKRFAVFLGCSEIKIMPLENKDLNLYTGRVWMMVLLYRDKHQPLQRADLLLYPCFQFSLVSKSASLEQVPLSEKYSQGDDSTLCCMWSSSELQHWCRNQYKGMDNRMSGKSFTLCRFPLGSMLLLLRKWLFLQWCSLPA